jgi:serine/threonine protein kinase HipA of HipAB toxin-antitoxin module
MPTCISKNWSLLYPDRHKPVLSPGYDFAATLPLSQIAAKTAERTAAWKTLEQADMLPEDLRTSIEKQIMAVADTVQ